MPRELTFYQLQYVHLYAVLTAFHLQLAYLVGLPPNEVPAVEIARGDLVEVVPASYGVLSRAYHFWSGEGRGDLTGANLYENFAESTMGKLGPDARADGGGLLPSGVTDIMQETDEEAKNVQVEMDKDQVAKEQEESGRGRSMSILNLTK